MASHTARLQWCISSYLKRICFSKVRILQHLYSAQPFSWTYIWVQLLRFWYSMARLVHMLEYSLTLNTWYSMARLMHKSSTRRGLLCNGALQAGSLSQITPTITLCLKCILFVKFGNRNVITLCLLLCLSVFINSPCCSLSLYLLFVSSSFQFFNILLKYIKAHNIFPIIIWSNTSLFEVDLSAQ